MIFDILMYQTIVCLVFLNKDIAKWLATFERKVLRIFGGTEVNRNLRKWYIKKLMYPFGDLDILSFVRISQLIWIGHVNRMDSKSKVKESKRKAIQVFTNNPQGKSTKRMTKKQMVKLCTNIFINADCQIGKRSKKTEQTGKGPLRRQRSALDFSAIEKEEVCLFYFTNCCHVSSCH